MYRDSVFRAACIRVRGGSFHPVTIFGERVSGSRIKRSRQQKRRNRGRIISVNDENKIIIPLTQHRLRVEKVRIIPEQQTLILITSQCAEQVSCRVISPHTRAEPCIAASFQRINPDGKEIVGSVK